MNLINFSTNFVISIEICSVLGYTMGITLQKGRFFMAYLRTPTRTSSGERKKVATSIQQGNASIAASPEPIVIGRYFDRYTKARGTKGYVSIKTLTVKGALKNSAKSYMLRATVLLMFIKHNLDFIEQDGFVEVPDKTVSTIKRRFKEFNGMIGQTQFSASGLNEDQLKTVVLNNILDNTTDLKGNVALFNELLKEIEDCEVLNENAITGIKTRFDALMQRSLEISSRIQSNQINLSYLVECASNNSPARHFV